jgi:hypothetical protein
MEARLTIGMHDRAAVELFEAFRNGMPQLRVYLGANPVPVFAGHWMPMRGTNSVDSVSSLELVFKDAFSRLAYRFTDATDTHTAEDAGLIATALIAQTNSFQGHTGIQADASLVQPTKIRDRTYEHKNVAEAITELTQVLEGFDWYATYRDFRNGFRSMDFNVVPSVGSDRPNAIFEFGAGTLENCLGYSFATSLPVNWVRALGAGSPPIVEEEANTESMILYTTFMALVSATDVSEAPTLADKAVDALRLHPVHVTEFSPDPAKAPMPWRDFWIGDHIRWNVDDGAFQQQLEPRVQTIEIGVDDSDNISDLVIGIDPASAGAYLPPANTSRAYVQGQRDLLRRVSALERS